MFILGSKSTFVPAIFESDRLHILGLISREGLRLNVKRLHPSRGRRVWGVGLGFGAWGGTGLGCRVWGLRFRGDLFLGALFIMRTIVLLHIVVCLGPPIREPPMDLDI